MAVSWDYRGLRHIVGVRTMVIICKKKKKKVGMKSVVSPCKVIFFILADLQPAVFL